MFCVGPGDANPAGRQGAFLPSVPKVGVFSTNPLCATLDLGAYSSPHDQCPPELPNREATGTSYSLPLPTRPLPPLRTLGPSSCLILSHSQTTHQKAQARSQKTRYSPPSPPSPHSHYILTLAVCVLCLTTHTSGIRGAASRGPEGSADKIAASIQSLRGL